MYFFYITLVIFNFLIIKYHKYLNIIGIPYDKPDNVRKFHKKNVLISGGFIMILNISFIFLYLVHINDSFIEDQFQNNLDLFLFLFLFFMMFLVGFFDDKKNIKPIKKLIFLGCLIFILIYFNENFLINEIRLSFIETKYYLQSLSLPFTILCFLLFINALNMFDGINLQNFIYSISVILFFLINDIFFNFYILLMIPMLTFGYLNLRNESFMGDSGCYVISLLFGSVFISSYNLNYIEYSDTIFLLMILPGIDMLRLFIVRISVGNNPFKADRKHLHHKLLKWLGFTKTSIILVFMQLIILSLIYIKFNQVILIIFILFVYFLLLLLSSKKNSKTI